MQVDLDFVRLLGGAMAVVRLGGYLVPIVVQGKFLVMEGLLAIHDL